jgi:glutamate-1-semialdehyde 2,1-aminomutase
VAAIIIEPILGNMAGTLPQPGWLEHVRRLCDEYGIVMIMDEVKTGFRVAPGGAQEYFGVSGDLVTYAKSVANGFPLAVIGGQKEFMSSVGPGRTAQGGTYCGNVVGTAAADATLALIAQGEVLKTVEARGRALMEGIGRILTDADMAHHLVGVPAMFGIVFAEEEPVDFRGWMKADHGLYTAIMEALIRRGAMPDPDGGEPWFLCAALSEQDVADTLTYFEEAVAEVKRDWPAGHAGEMEEDSPGA